MSGHRSISAMNRPSRRCGRPRSANTRPRFSREGRAMQGHNQIGPQRYRESFGRYYDDFVVGDVYEHRPGRTITESDNTWFTLITMNKHPLHFDKEYAAKSEFKRPLVNSGPT